MTNDDRASGQEDARERRRLKAQELRKKDANARKRRRLGIVGAVGAVVIVAGSALGVAFYKEYQDSNGPAVAPKNAIGTGIQVSTGTGDSPKTLALYEDFQCPNCGNFEALSGETIKGVIDANSAAVSYHIMNFLGPESTRAANAAACAANEDKFLAYHDVLYQNQPVEHTGGFTNEQLVSLGQSANMSDKFESCVNEGEFVPWVKSIQSKIAEEGVEQTPTVKVDGKALEQTALSPEGLTAALSS